MHSFASILTVVLIAASTLFQPAVALPGGAPRCIINQTVITNGIKEEGHGAMRALGFTLSAASTTYTPGQMMAINLNNLPTFARGGILAYVTQDSAPLNHVGSFMLTGSLRAQTATVCQGQGVVNDAATSTITHMLPLPNTNVATLMWTAPATNVGPVTVNAVVATGSVGQPWQIFPVLKLQPAGGTGAAAPAAPPVAPIPPTQAPAKQTTSSPAAAAKPPAAGSSSPAAKPPVAVPPAAPTSPAAAPQQKVMTVFVPPGMQVVVQTMAGLNAPMATVPTPVPAAPAAPAAPAVPVAVPPAMNNVVADNDD